jgi:streptogramin lyase
MPGGDHIHVAARRGDALGRERSQVLRLFAPGFAIVAALAIALGATLSAAQAAGLFKFTQYKVPTADSEPGHITVGSDGNLWFTEGSDFFTPNPDPETGGIFHNQIGRITPEGEITEESRAVKDDPNSGLDSAFGITMGPDGQSVWYTKPADNKIARLTLR